MFFFLFKFAPDRYKTLEMCNRVVSEDPFLIVYCSDIYITKKSVMILFMIAALKLIPYWFVTSKMI